jgi:hypothetical protein
LHVDKNIAASQEGNRFDAIKGETAGSEWNQRSTTLEFQRGRSGMRGEVLKLFDKLFK